MVIELMLVFIVVLSVIGIYYLLKSVKHLIVNTVLGLVLLVVSNAVFHVGIDYTSIPVLLVCALGGIPGAILVILLHILNIAFV